MAHRPDHAVYPELRLAGMSGAVTTHVQVMHQPRRRLPVEPSHGRVTPLTTTNGGDYREFPNVLRAQWAFNASLARWRAATMDFRSHLWASVSVFYFAMKRLHEPQQLGVREALSVRAATAVPHRVYPISMKMKFWRMQ